MGPAKDQPLTQMGFCQQRSCPQTYKKGWPCQCNDLCHKYGNCCTGAFEGNCARQEGKTTSSNGTNAVELPLSYGDGGFVRKAIAADWHLYLAPTGQVVLYAQMLGICRYRHVRLP